MTIFVEHYISQSSIHGRGTFAKKPLRKGTIVFYWPVKDEHEVCEEGAVKDLMRESENIRQSSVRLIGKYFFFSRADLEDDEILNHSSDANVLYHLTFGIARRDIAASEELTIDYRLLNPASFGGEVGTIPGLSSRTSIQQSSEELLEIIRSVPDWTG